MIFSVIITMKQPLVSIQNFIGRPPTYTTPEQLATKAEEYFKRCLEEEIQPTISGVTLFLGFTSRQSFYNLENNPDLMDTVKAIRLMIEASYEALGCSGGNHTTFAIFALKSMGWTDKPEILKQIKEHQNPFEGLTFEQLERLASLGDD